MVTGPRTASQIGRERLTFNFGSQGTVPSRALVEAALASAAEPTFSSAPYAEPRDWGYLGLLAFTTVIVKVTGTPVLPSRMSLRMKLAIDG